MSVSVRWRRHAAALAAGAADLLQCGRLADVTLVAQGASVRAHRLLLAACSQLFSDIFEDDILIIRENLGDLEKMLDLLEASIQQNPFEHPIIVLNNISSTALHAILFYIYNGEVSVSEEYLPTLMEAAEYLKIKGLTFDTESDDIEKIINSDDKQSLKKNEDARLSDTNDITKISDNLHDEIVPKIEPMDENVETIMRDGFESTLSIGDGIDLKSTNKETGKKIKKKTKIGRRHSKTCKRSIVKMNKENEDLPTDTSVVLEQNADSLVLDFDNGMECLLLNENLTETMIEEEPHDADYIEEDKDLNIRHTFGCPFCNRVYHSWGYRRRHIKAYHETNSLTCKFCLINLDSEVAWFDHVIKDHQIRRSEARESLVIMVEAHTVLSSSPPSPISMLNHLQLDLFSQKSDGNVTNDRSLEI